MKILCITPVSHIKGIMDILKSCGEVLYSPLAKKHELIKMLSICEGENVVLFVNPNQMTFTLDEEVLCHQNIKIVCTASTGLNHIDINYCREKDIDVLSLTTDFDIIEQISSTAEMAFALMLSLIRNIPSSFKAVQNFEWKYESFIGRQLDHLRIGIVGYGRLGIMMAQYCKAFGMDVRVCDPYKDVSPYQACDLKSIFRICDVVSLHVHVSEETTEMINNDILCGMGSNQSYLVNTSRGIIVNEDHVIQNLNRGNLLGYATDVISDEYRNIQNSPIIRESENLNIIITPHIGGMTKEAQEIAYCAAANKILHVIGEWDG